MKTRHIDNSLKQGTKYHIYIVEKIEHGNVVDNIEYRFLIYTTCYSKRE